MIQVLRILLLHVFVQESSSRLSTIVAIVVLGHEASNTSHRRILSKTSDLSIGFNSVVFECLQRNSLVDALGLLWFGIDLLLTLLTSTTKTKDQVKCRFFLNIVITECPTIFQLLSSKDQTLLIRRNSLFILNLGLDIINGIRRFHIQCDRLTWKGKRKAVIS